MPKRSNEAFSRILIDKALEDSGWNLFGCVATGMTMGVLNAGLLKLLQFLVPPLALQNECDRRMTEIRALEAVQIKSRESLDALFRFFLHRAFNGEL